MRFEKQFFESTSFNDAGEKEIKVKVNAEIILSIEEVNKILTETAFSLNPVISDLSSVVEEAKKFIKENSDEE